MFSFAELLLTQASLAQWNRYPKIQIKNRFQESSLQAILLLEWSCIALPYKMQSQTHVNISHPNPCCISDLSSGFISQCTWCVSAHFIKLLFIPGIVKQTPSFPGIPVLAGSPNHFKQIPSFWFLGNLLLKQQSKPHPFFSCFSSLGLWVALSKLVGYHS